MVIAKSISMSNHTRVQYSHILLVSKISILIFLWLIFACGSQDREQTIESTEESLKEHVGEPETGSTENTSEEMLLEETPVEDRVYDLLDLLHDEDKKVKEKAARELIAIGDQALEPVMEFLESNGRYALAWTFYLDQDTLRKAWTNPVDTLVKYYIRHNFVSPDSITDEKLEPLVTSKAKRLLDVEDKEKPNLIVKGLFGKCANPTAEEIWVEITNAGNLEGSFLVTGTCYRNEEGEEVRFKLVSNFYGPGSGVALAEVYPRR